MRRAVFLFIWAGAALAADGDLQKASIGDLKLENGGTIRNCVVAYRTFGVLNGLKSNAILFPTWFSGRSESLADFFGPGKLVDTTRFFGIAVDALGDGHSSSPSNSQSQPRLKFPEFTIRDMVESQHRLLTGTLGIAHLYAVMGVSMGGMQTFQWITAYPEFMDRAIPIVGSPRLSPVDLLLWNTEKHAIESGKDWLGGNYAKAPAGTMQVVSDIHEFALSTPRHRNETLTRQGFTDFMRQSETDTLAGFDANDWYRQLEAMLALDVSKPFGGSMADAAKAVRAKVLVIASAQDHMVNPDAAIEFSKLLGVRPLILESDCGHLAPGCEGEKVRTAVAAFLQ